MLAVVTLQVGGDELLCLAIGNKNEAILFGQITRFDYDGFWRRSLATALASQSAANLTNIVEPDEAYCFGLLSKIGRLGLATAHPDRYSELLQGVSDANDLVEAELQAFGISHDQLTAALFESLTTFCLPRSHGCFALMMTLTF